MTTYKKSDPETIQKMFGNIAENYDRTNAALSFQLHKWWNKKLVNLIKNKFPEGTWLDLCCGTGDIAFGYLKSSVGTKKSVLLDFCPEMLEYAKMKAEKLNLSRHEIDYICGDAMAIPLPDDSVTGCTIAYGIRNVKEPKLCVQEVFRTLKPGGCFGILELTNPKNRFMRMGHSLYLKTVLPLIGKLLTSDKEAYRYLLNSIHSFIPPEQLEDLLKEVGFVNTRCYPLTGGIATIIYGESPSNA